MILVHEDETIEDTERGIIHFGLARFVSKIAEGECCFVCGASPEVGSFNDEHILPAWLIKRY
jgi:hypothetical protein